MYLVDANVLLEVILKRQHTDAAAAFLSSVDGTNLYVTEFGMFSVAIYLFKRSWNLWIDFLRDIEQAKVNVIRLALNDEQVQIELRRAAEYGLDFDDAYQFTAAVLNDLKIVSLDTDFDRTPLGRLTPEQATQN
ncbi:MAG: type II toxin-antitoxin system VapC family toxin [Candidatus Hydrogenedentes bacterium]|nr:type II toxin-antitoxin system VapC family toxin [Candidatus Hydrogenedentota bacterium]